MQQISYKLDGFEGPLDLLLFLITKHKLDINNIQISLLLDQYLEYIDGLSEYDFEYAGEFLEMAARLVLIKTLSLLPRHEEAEELRRELNGRLIEYSICKQAAARLKDDYAGDAVFVREPTEPPADNTYRKTHDTQELLNAYRRIYDKRLLKRPVEPSAFKPIVSHKIVSVTTGIISVLRRLYKTGSCPMSEIFESKKDKSEKIAVFLAVLELTKSGRVRISDDNKTISFEGRRALHAT